MQVIELDSSEWLERMDFWHALRQALAVVPEHGTGFDAFVDSIFYHPQMLGVQPPVMICVRQPHPAIRADVEQMSSCLAEAREWRRSHHGDDIDASLHLVDPAH